MNPSTEPPARETYRHGDLRRALLDAGIALAREGGPAAVTLREAAADDSALRLNADRALQDVARAARALRELGELLEQWVPATCVLRRPRRACSEPRLHCLTS